MLLQQAVEKGKPVLYLSKPVLGHLSSLLFCLNVVKNVIQFKPGGLNPSGKILQFRDID